MQRARKAKMYTWEKSKCQASIQIGTQVLWLKKKCRLIPAAWKPILCYHMKVLPLGHGIISIFTQSTYFILIKLLGQQSQNVIVVSFCWTRWSKTMMLLQYIPQPCRNSPGHNSWPRCPVSSESFWTLWQHPSATALTWRAGHLCLGPAPAWRVKDWCKSFSMKRHNRYAEKVLVPYSYILLKCSMAADEK